MTLKIYQSCGTLKISSSAKAEITIKTMLPELNIGTYSYLKYYNISTKKHYGILGVLKVMGEDNIDLRTYPSSKPPKLIDVENKPIILKDVELYGKRDFSNISESDTIHFVCFHDDKFEENKKKVLDFYQKKLPNIIDLDYYPEKKRIDEPKIGNGGILHFNGC